MIEFHLGAQEDYYMPYLFAIIGLLVVLNFYMLFRRSRKGRNVGKDATAERIATAKHHDDLVRRLDREQEEAARHVELRNKTLEMYEQARRQGEANEQDEE